MASGAAPTPQARLSARSKRRRRLRPMRALGRCLAPFFSGSARRQRMPLPLSAVALVARGLRCNRSKSRFSLLSAKTTRGAFRASFTITTVVTGLPTKRASAGIPNRGLWRRSASQSHRLQVPLLRFRRVYSVFRRRRRNLLCRRVRWRLAQRKQRGAWGVALCLQMGRLRRRHLIFRRRRRKSLNRLIWRRQRCARCVVSGSQTRRRWRRHKARLQSSRATVAVSFPRTRQGSSRRSSCANPSLGYILLLSNSKRSKPAAQVLVSLVLFLRCRRVYWLFRRRRRNRLCRRVRERRVRRNQRCA